MIVCTKEYTLVFGTPFLSLSKCKHFLRKFDVSFFQISTPSPQVTLANFSAKKLTYSMLLPPLLPPEPLATAVKETFLRDLLQIKGEKNKSYFDQPSPFLSIGLPTYFMYGTLRRSAAAQSPASLNDGLQSTFTYRIQS